MNDLHQTSNPPTRIISVVPSQTELLHELGLRDEVIGITKFCVHPKEWHHSKVRVGGTKTLQLELIHSLKPDLILANKEENNKEQIENLQQQYPVYISDVRNIEDALHMITRISELVHKQTEASKIISRIENALKNNGIKHRRLKTIYLIWKDPFMASGIDTFIHSMMQEGGFTNCVLLPRYPILTNEELRKMNPELVLLSSEPYPFKQKHIEELARLLPEAQIKLANGELFSWYGSRMSQSFDYFSALHEELR